ncbi:MAG: DNA-directed DNA polymerase [Ignavibacteria bacterium]|nr:MAG: DNA-directed DNA polymerase [Ignavibacteria bacterium]KAF0156189.1 MAG: DNA-directed DNA polymerase [Ignavibacteria bacterium]
MPLRNLYVDFNSYFASVEQQLNPNLRNKPVGVVPVMTDRTCCIAASYEAKKFGIKTGTPVSEAKRLCPSINLIEARHKVYIEYHHKLINTIETCIHVDQIMSIDEVVCSLMGKEQNPKTAMDISLKIKNEIASKVGEYIKCSIGIGPNRFLSKTATDMKKPDGLTIIEEHDLPGILYSLKINDIVGVGRGMEVRLRKNGIYTVEQLCGASKSKLHEIWGGIEGERMYSQLRGEVVKRPPTHRTVVGHSHVLPPEQRNRDEAFAVINRLLQKAAMRMRYLGYASGAMSISVRFLGSQKWKNEMTFNHTQNTISLLNILKRLWDGYPKENFTPLAVGVTIYKLIEERYNTPHLFEDYDKAKSLTTAIDKLNKKYGFASAYYAPSHTAIKSAPMRIAFTQIPDLDIEDDEKKF